jgi:hypothetical protein
MMLHVLKLVGQTTVQLTLDIYTDASIMDRDPAAGELPPWKRGAVTSAAKTAQVLQDGRLQSKQPD